MAFIPTPNGVKVEIEYLISGRLMYNILTVDVTEPVTEVLVDEVAGLVAGWAQADLGVLIALTAQINSVSATGMNAVETWSAVVTSGFPLNGDVNSPLLPTSVAACVSLRTGFTGRSARGRLFLPGLTETQIAGNTIDPAWVNNITTAFEELRTILATNYSGGGWSVTSFINAGVPRTAGRQLPITTVQVDSRVDTQRRRLG